MTVDTTNYSYLITGGTGSFGSKMVARLLAEGAARVVVYSRDEKKQHDLMLKHNDPRLELVIGDVRDYERVRSAMRGIDYVFSAAALKQVPSCESCPVEAVRTNILGTDNVCQAAIASGVKAVCILSTDKAVLPINAMGMTKALAEKVMSSHAGGLARGNHLTKFVAVRYGNVMGSRGSVLETWLNAPVINITDGHMTRFCMNMDDAINLVFTALESPAENAGCVFVHPAGAATVYQLATAFKEVFKNPSKPIFVTGIRPGEKEFETLIGEHEIKRTTVHHGHFCIWPTTPDAALGKLEAPYTSDEAPKIMIQELMMRVAKALR